MKLKLFAAAAALAVSGVASASTTVSWGTLSDVKKSFSGVGDTTYTFDVSGLYSSVASVTLTVAETPSTNPAEHVYFDGTELVASGPVTVWDSDFYMYSYSTFITSGAHSLSIVMFDQADGFAGSVKLSYVGPDTPTPAVPEPESYALALAGLGVVGMLSRRRKAA